MTRQGFCPNHCNNTTISVILSKCASCELSSYVLNLFVVKDVLQMYVLGYPCALIKHLPPKTPGVVGLRIFCCLLLDIYFTFINILNL